MTIESVCNVCNKTYIYNTKKRSGNRRNYCGSCLVQKRRKKLKQLSVEYKGGKCILCGYDKCVAALEFHHVNPNEKLFGLSTKGLTRSWEKIKTELDKTVLLCANCHREVESGIVEIN